MKFKTLGVGALVLAGLFAAALPSQAQQQRKLTVWWVKGFYKAEDEDRKSTRLNSSHT